MKPLRALGWEDVAKRDDDAALARRCAEADAAACQELVVTHRQMVYALGYQLLGSHDEALDLS